jgi:hypothetical protein
MRKLICLLLPALLLSGCFEYAEDVRVHADASAELRMEWGFDEEVVEDPEEFRESLEEIKRALEEHPEVTGVEVDDWADDGMHRYSLLLRVTHYRHLEALFDAACDRGLGQLVPADASHTKTFEFEELDDGTLRVTRHLDPDGDGSAGGFSLQPGRGDKEGEEENPFAGKAITFRFHAPQVLDAEDDGDLDGGTVEWRYPLDQEDVQLPRRLRAHVALETEFSWGLLLSSLFGLGAMMWLRQKWHRRWE